MDDKVVLHARPSTTPCTGQHGLADKRTFRPSKGLSLHQHCINSLFPSSRCPSRPQTFPQCTHITGTHIHGRKIHSVHTGGGRGGEHIERCIRYDVEDAGNPLLSIISSPTNVDRCILIEDREMLEPHEASSKPPIDFYLKDQKIPHTETRACTHLFLQEGVAWLERYIRTETIEGSLSCPKCDCRLGGFNWAGIRCSCGGWVVPGIALLCSKIDIITHDQFDIKSIL